MINYNLERGGNLLLINLKGIVDIGLNIKIVD